MDILIIDDEPKIRNGLKQIIGKLNQNWNVIGTAEDGCSALEIIEGSQPDVLLLDIRMPNMNGLDLLEKIYSEKKDIIVVVVSGHAEFEYAQRAMRYGVLDYILKPVSPQRVKDVLEKADKIIAGRNELIAKNVYVDNSINELREKFLHDIIFETDYVSEDDAREKCDLLNLSLGRFCILTLMLGLEDEVKQDSEIPVNNAKLKSAFYEVLERYDGGYVLCNGIGSFIIVVKLGTYGDEENQIKSIFNELLLHIGKDINTISGFGGIYDEISKAYLSYRESLLAIRGKNPVKSGNSLQNDISDTIAVKIVNDIRNNSRTYSVLIRQSVDYILKNYQRNNLKIDDIAKNVYVHSNYLSDIFKKETGENISDFIAECRLEKAKELLLNFENKIYMVAEKVGFNEQRYFSQVFKKKTGMTPVEYREKYFVKLDA